MNVSNDVKKARMAASVLLTVWASLFFLWFHFSPMTGQVEQVLLAIGMIEIVLAVMAALFHFYRRARFDHSKDGNSSLYFLPFVFAFIFGFALMLQSLGAPENLIRIMPFSAVFFGESLLLYGIDRRLAEKGGLSHILWTGLVREQKTAEVALCIMILMISGGLATISNGYSVLSQIPDGYYPPTSQADPQGMGYAIPLGNMTIELNITHITYKEEFVVGEYIRTEVTLTATEVNESINEPHLKSLMFPEVDEWDFHNYRVWSNDEGDSFFASGSRLYQEPGTHNTTQVWLVTDGSGTNHTLPVFLNLTVYGRQAIESFERDRELWRETYLQLYFAQRQEGYNLIVIGFSLIFVAALIPEMARLFGRLATRPGSENGLSKV